MDDSAALADAETYLVHVLETSNPRRDPALYNLTEAARDFHDTSGNWEIRQADPNTVEDILSRHAK